MNLSARPPGPAELVLRRVRAPLRRAHRGARTVETVREVVVVQRVDDDGVVGWSECPTLSTPGYATETTDEAWTALTSRLGPGLLAGSMPAQGDPLASSAALLDVSLDVSLRRRGLGLRSHLGGVRSTVERCEVLAGVGESPDALASRAVLAARAGASMIKLKVRPGADLDALRAVLDAVELPVAADANGSYGDARELLEVDRLGLAYLEQPLPPAAGPSAHAELRRVLRTPIALDESITSVEDLAAAVATRALDAVSIKPARLGGVEQAARAVRLASEAGLDAFVGGMLELGIGRAAAAAVASMPGCTLPTDLGPSAQYVEHDLCEPIVTDDHGRLVVPEGPGSGRTPLPEVLDELTVAAVRLSA